MVQATIHKMWWGMGVLGLLALVAVGGWAGEQMACEMGKSDAGIAWMHGGVGKDSRMQMQEMAKKEGYTHMLNCAGTNPQ